jgi:excisionase family DNA binding protein
MPRARAPSIRSIQDPNRSLTTSQVAEHERVSAVTVRRWIRRGLLPAVRVGRDYPIWGADLITALWRANPHDGWQLAPGCEAIEILWRTTSRPVPAGPGAGSVQIGKARISVPRAPQFSTAAVGKLLSVSERFVRNEIRAGRLTASRRSRSYLINRAEVIRYTRTWMQRSSA